jgi:membrane protein implicated in regulation of membrane protease activity
MGMHIIFWYWWVAAVAFVGVEMLTPGFFFIWMGFSAFITGSLIFFLPAVSTEFQLSFFAVLSMVSAIWGRNYLKKHEKQTDHPHLNQRGAQYIGRTFTVIEAIQNGSGKVKVADSPWRVEGEDCPVGSTVRVVAVDGTTLKVIRVD